MKRKSSFWTGAIFVLLTIIFNIVSFWFIEDYTTSFWVSVAFGNASIVMFALASFAINKKGKDVYLDYQNDMVIGGYYILCNILNICFILFKMQNTKVNLFVNILLLAIYLVVLFIFFGANANTRAQIEYDKQERDAFYLLKEKAELLLDKNPNRQVNKKIEYLYDRICSCQINRAANVADMDEQILSGLNALSTIVRSDDADAIISKITSILDMIEERDRRIRNSLAR